MARVVGLKVVALVALASVAGESWVLAPLYHTERPVHVSVVAWRAAAGGGAWRARGARVHARGGARAVHGRVRARCMGACRLQRW